MGGGYLKIAREKKKKKARGAASRFCVLEKSLGSRDGMLNRLDLQG